MRCKGTNPRFIQDSYYFRRSIQGWAGKRNKVETHKANRPCPSTTDEKRYMMGTLRFAHPTA